MDHRLRGGDRTSGHLERCGRARRDGAVHLQEEPPAGHPRLHPAAWDTDGDGVTDVQLTRELGWLQVYGTDGPDVISAHGGGELGGEFPGVFRVSAGGGDDVLTGGAGPDAILAGEDGKDTITAGSGPARLIGGSKHDTLQGGPADDLFDGGAGPDTLDGGPGHDYLNGGGGNDVIHAADGEADQVIGNRGTDEAFVDGGVDTVDSVEIVH
jgi:Ca2+-binding RTX toxin-like protein